MEFHIYESNALAKRYASDASGRDVHADIPLSNFAVSAFNRQRDQYVAAQILPAVTVGKQNDRYYKIEKGAFLRAPDTKRSRGTPANRVKWQVSSETYYAENYALAGEIPIEDITNSDAPVRLRENTVDLVVQNLLQDYEQRASDLLTTSGNLGNTFAVSSAWNDVANSNPIIDVKSAHAYIRQQTGLIANTLLMDWDSWQDVRRNANVAELFKYTEQGLNSPGVIANVFEVDRIIIGRAVKNTAPEGQTPVMANVWGNNAVLAHVEPNPMSLQSMTMGVTMRWQSGIYPADFGVLRSVINQAGSEHVEIVETGTFQDERITAPDLGVLIADTLG